MATNTNTNNNIELSSDIYDVSGFLDQIRQNNIPNLNETSSMIGIFGYMNEMFSQSLQNTLIVTSETSNEAIPTRAKFTKNIINHAMNLGITDIFAKPATMSMMIYLPLSYIEKNFVELDQATGKAKFILDNKVPIYIDKYEYHLDYDVIITRIRNPQGKYIYTAIYDLFEDDTINIKQDNPLSNISNPYVTTILQANIDNNNYIAFAANLHQIEMIETSTNILTDNFIENKSVTFDFEDQLASFDIDVDDNGIITHLTPIYMGLLDNTMEDGKWCYYEFIDEHTIRVIFNRDSYIPKLNSVVNINIKLCSGSSANFTYNNTFRTSLKSEKYNDYNGMYAIIQPLQNGLSYGGKDKKSISDLKKIIPREASSRGAIINTTDLQNFFNSINDDICRVYFKKKRDNQFERMYYSYLLMKKDGFIYPTNTLNLRIKQDDFSPFAKNNNLVISPGTKFYYYNHGTDVANDYATIEKPNYEVGLDPDKYPFPMTINKDGNLVRVFEYISPFLISIDEDLVSTYMMTLMNENKLYKFSSINIDSDVQFIATNMNWRRSYISNDSIYDNKYILDVDVIQNNDSDYKLVTYHTDDNDNKVFDDVRIKVIMVLYTDDTETTPYKYIEAELYDINDVLYKFKFTFYTDDYIDLGNRINIIGVYNTKPEEFQSIESLKDSHGYMNKNTFAKIFIMADFGVKVGDIINGITATTNIIKTYGTNGNRTEIEKIIPTKNDIINAYLSNKINSTKDNKLNSIISIIKSNPEYVEAVKNYNKNDLITEDAIINYIKNNRNSNIIQDRILKNDTVKAIIDSYNYVDLERYTVCNTLTLDGGLDFYHDYSQIMRSSVTVDNIPVTDKDGNIIYKEISRRDTYGYKYTEYKPIWLTNENNIPIYNYSINRVPMIKNGFLDSEEMVQEYIYSLEERRKYINECLLLLEDTFDIDLKFFNTYGPSKMFYYDIPSSQNYKVKVTVKRTNVYRNTLNEIDVIDILPFGTELLITKVNGQWGYNPTYDGWIKLLDTTKLVNYIDNVALNFKFALQTQTSADKYITNNIVTDIKEYIEDISSINELHIPNIITLITNNYRNQLIYFEFLGINEYGSACQHLYLNEKIEADICPEFLNIEISDDGTQQPLIDILTY